MTPAQFQMQCLEMLGAAREWPDSTWEKLSTPTMDVLDTIMELEDVIENGK